MRTIKFLQSKRTSRCNSLWHDVQLALWKASSRAKMTQPGTNSRDHISLIINDFTDSLSRLIWNRIPLHLQTQSRWPHCTMLSEQSTSLSGCLWFPVSKGRMGGRAFSYQAPLLAVIIRTTTTVQILIPQLLTRSLYGSDWCVNHMTSVSMQLHTLLFIPS